MVLPEASTDNVRYLVLESSQKAGVTRLLYDQTGNPEWVYLFADTDWQLYLAESPIVLKATQQSPEYQWAVQELKGGELTGLILESSDGLEAVAGWLRARLKVRFDGHRQGLLRFYDPKIWHRLSPTFSQNIDVVERVIYWYGNAGEGRWKTNEKPSPFTMFPMPTLNETQWKTLNTVTA